ncbi:MAG: DUF4258 domain-containing protein [Dehalococcoidia bacterium]|nr:DUF4258 domain-containing protein [Chloroflexota bacterium]MXW25571.1 DUF4258 domain-containing protein [Dehalococcoidia bacterium]MYA52974.1 DUF4258 domain-containing protein [Dehalococcoidia bacterium]
MTIAYSRHARDKMEERGITEQVVQQILDSPDGVAVGETAVIYNAMVNGVELRVVVARATDPVLVITVFPVDR